MLYASCGVSNINIADVVLYLKLKLTKNIRHSNCNFQKMLSILVGRTMAVFEELPTLW